jgi:hypothetical protein
MSKFVIYVELKPFVAQWAVNHYGRPLTFPPQSVGNARIVSVLRKRPEGVPPDVDGEGLTPVAIPYSKKEPESWNYVSQNGKRFIVQYIDALFRDNMYSELNAMCQDDSKIQTACYAWCEKHGISIEYADTIRQRFYRERRQNLDYGVDLRRKKRVKKEKEC